MSDRSASEKNRLDSPQMAGQELIAELRSTLERAGELIRVVESNLRESPAPRKDESSYDDRIAEREHRLATA
ncbi:MAG TPA: hypothetical protein VG477_07295 [Thermoanaerobaculia bacterium]|nr:hypothetical protein [Thermoanaerobaculia bacterium]